MAASASAARPELVAWLAALAVAAEPLAQASAVVARTERELAEQVEVAVALRVLDRESIAQRHPPMSGRHFEVWAVVERLAAGLAERLVAEVRARFPVPAEQKRSDTEDIAPFSQASRHP